MKFSLNGHTYTVNQFENTNSQVSNLRKPKKVQVTTTD